MGESSYCLRPDEGAQIKRTGQEKRRAHSPQMVKYLPGDSYVVSSGYDLFSYQGF